MASFGRFVLLPFFLLFMGMSASPAFAQCTPDVNADDAVNANDALILYYAYSLRGSLGDGRGGGAGGAGTAQANIADSGGGVSIAAENPIVTEGSPAVFVLTAGAAAQSAFTVNVDVAATGDFGVTTDARPVEFETNDVSVTLSVETMGDDAIETWGTVTATIQCSADYQLGATSRASVMVADDDVTVSIAVETSTVVENSAAVFVLTASSSPLTAFTANVEVAATGDFNVTTGVREVMFAAGETSATLSVTTTGDGVSEPSGTVTATVAAGFGYMPDDTAGTASVTVMDDDLSISIAPRLLRVLEGEPAVFILTASLPAPAGLTVNVEVAATGDFGVTKTGVQPVAFEAASTTATLSIPTMDDTDTEEEGTVTATMQAGTDFAFGASVMATVTIVDDETGGTLFRDCDDCPEMVVVPGGTFQMGSPAGEGEDNERPQHEVTIDYSFAVGRYEVTFDEWLECHGAWDTSGGTEGCANHPGDQGWGEGRQPVININWEEHVQAYLTWLSATTGETYRLLTEAEWEYAARASSTTTYHWGDDVTGANSGKANCDGCGGAWDPPAEGSRRPAPVGSYEPNAFGLYDMLGNVAEWVQDCWHDNYTGAPANGDAWENGEDCNPVIRGGWYSGGPAAVRSAARLGVFPSSGHASFVGFRVARTLD